jgi:LemA protein
MDIASIIFWAVVAGLVLYIISVYNHLVRLKHNVSKAWSNIDVLLKQRHDEIPKLVETCKQYMEFEQETLEKVMQARSSVAQARQSQDVPGLGLAEGALRMGLGLQSRISALEDTIADRREFYNESANINNIGIETFPDIIVARLFRFGERDLLEFEASQIADVNVKQLFQS